MRMANDNLGDAFSKTVRRKFQSSSVRRTIFPVPLRAFSKESLSLDASPARSCRLHQMRLIGRFPSIISDRAFGNALLLMSAASNHQFLQALWERTISVHKARGLIRRPQDPLERCGKAWTNSGFSFKVAVVSHDKRHAKSSGSNHRVPWGVGRLVILGQSSPAASVKAAPALTRLLLRRATGICLCP